MLNTTDYQVRPNAYYVTRSVLRVLPADDVIGRATDEYELEGRTATGPYSSKADAMHEAELAAARAVQDEGLRHVSGGKRSAGVWQPLILRFTGGYAVDDRRVEFNWVTGRERLAQIALDLADRQKAIDRAGRKHWGLAWDGVLARATELVEAMGVPTTTLLAKVQVAHLAWEWCSDVQAAKEGHDDIEAAPLTAQGPRGGA